MNEIYAISDDILSPDDVVLEHVLQILKSGVRYYQYRCKKTNKNLELAKQIHKLCLEYGAKFIINDDVEFASLVGVKNVHIGKDDEGIKKAKEILGKDAYIGVSCYGDLERALSAQSEGASYVAFGSVFSSPTKPKSEVINLEILKQAKKCLDIPICAIGGIDASNISEISKYNINLIAIVSAIYKPDSIEKNILNLKSKI